MTWSLLRTNESQLILEMPRRNRKRNSKAKPAKRTRRDTHSNRLDTVQSGNASDRGASRASSPFSAHAPPIHRLPAELLCETFLLASLTDDELCKWSRIRPDLRPQLTNPFTFCAVCSLWRSLAFSLPQLWQRVFVYVSPDSRRTGGYRLLFSGSSALARCL